jgi:ubiquinone/menaquinone biosynthesis C-methylase UbiE
MRRLNKTNLNTPEMSNDMFIHRWKEEEHYIDFKRFQELVKHFKGGRYLDAGCFNSPMAHEIIKTFPNTESWGLDHAHYVIEVLKKRHPQVNYIVGDIYNMGFDNEYFDYIVMGEVLEHLERPEDAIREGMRVLKSGGYLAVSVPFEEITSQPAVSDEHLWAYTKKDIKDLLSSYGEVEIVTNNDNVKIIIGYVKKA